MILAATAREFVSKPEVFLRENPWPEREGSFPGGALRFFGSA